MHLAHKAMLVPMGKRRNVKGRRMQMVQGIIKHVHRVLQHFSVKMELKKCAMKAIIQRKMPQNAQNVRKGGRVVKVCSAYVQMECGQNLKELVNVTRSVQVVIFAKMARRLHVPLEHMLRKVVQNVNLVLIHSGVPLNRQIVHFAKQVLV